METVEQGKPVDYAELTKCGVNKGYSTRIQSKVSMGSTRNVAPMTRISALAAARPGVITVIATVVGYALVIGTFLGLVPIYPSIDLQTSTTLSHVIAAVNALTVICLVIGWYSIRSGKVTRHRVAMISAFGFILLFLVLYLTRVGGGGTKHFVGPELVTVAYQAMLGIHILLSILAVPLVIYALVLGLTRTPAELRATRHAQVGRVAAASWLLSLLLGLVTYVMLEHLYSWEYVVALVGLPG